MMMGRRMFFLSAASLAGGLVYVGTRRTAPVEAGAVEGAAKEVNIVEFADDGTRKGVVRVPKVVKTDKEWRAQLSPLAYAVTRKEDTENAFSGKLWNLHDKGIYRCICCDTAVFSSETKFDSRTGWPSFWQVIAKENVQLIEDHSFGLDRTAVACTRCDGHLGHLFDDGPNPTGLRYCMNSVSMKFVKSPTGA